MIRYVVKRLLIMIPTLLAVGIIMFTLMNFVPGDPAQLALGSGVHSAAEIEAKREALGLNRPFIVRLGEYISNIFLRFDFGKSLVYFILPTIANSLGGLAGFTRQVRASMLEVVSSDYVTTARSKGLPEKDVIYGHALPNALIPILTVIGMRFGSMLGGATIIEVVFSIPGIGQYLVNSINNRDYNACTGCIIFIAFAFAIIMLLTDLLYAYADPRIKAHMSDKKEQFFELQNLTVQYHSGNSIIHAVNDVSLSLAAGETLGLVGETGAGKTTIAKSILQILPRNSVESVEGRILFEGNDILQMSDKELQSIRGKAISMIFQDPMTALNPVKPVADQIAEGYRLHQGCTKAEAKEHALSMLKMVGIGPDRANEFPHQFSGGMKQRVVIALALACSPRLLLADEPTTALDVSIQAQIINLLMDLQDDMGLTYLFITHDMSVVKHISHQICVMYLGQMVELCDRDELFAHPLHPYTKALLSAIPTVDIHKKKERILLKGEIKSPIDPGKECRFCSRCVYADESCRQGVKLCEVRPGHMVACNKAAEINDL